MLNVNFFAGLIIPAGFVFSSAASKKVAVDDGCSIIRDEG